MKYSKLIFITCVLGMVSCKTAKKKNIDTATTNEKPELIKKEKEAIFYTEQIRNDFRAVSASTQQKFLEMYDATAKEYSILFFTQGFTGEEMVVKNNNSTLYKGMVFTEKSTGLAKNMRIVNTEITSIYDKATQKTIYINTDKATKHKFIYVMKGDINTEKPYKITFSNKLRPEK
ncbi:hypothetical protein [Paenimyroides aestuarii]|uniref:Uncharacterized protein n=1 Tax=Paenimyroides aestuarii TaxID=2968490 RepID=A0ABY5NPT6_9FLAO|nr:hypothetical protein [Paenimyroides aestuarii]UUV20540.1 hypothetical protein NPX36_09250 [Paenimyroides aestuarii]